MFISKHEPCLKYFYLLVSLLALTVGGPSPSEQPPRFCPTSPPVVASGEVLDVASSIMTIIRRLDWISVIVISEGLEEPWDITNSLLSSLSADFRKFTIFHPSVAWQPQALPAMVSLGPGSATQTLRIVLICSLACVTSVLDGARKFENRWKSQTVLNYRSRWLVHVTDVTELTQVDWNNVTMDNVAFTVQTRFPRPRSYPGSAMVTAQNKAFGVYTLMLHRHSRELQFVSNCCEDFTKDAEQMFPNVQHGLNGKQLRIGMKPWIQFTVSHEDSGSMTYGGFDLMLLDALAQSLNFTYKIVFSEDSRWGGRREDGNWTGIIGMLQRREIDVAAQPYHRSESREAVADFSNVLDINMNTFVYRRSPPTSYGFLTYFKPLRLQVIFAIFAAMLVTTALMYAVEHPLEAESAQHSSGSDQWWRRMRSLGDCLQFSFGALLLQADSRELRSWSERTVVSSWWLFCVIIAATYTGNLVAFLTVLRESFSISSLEDLVSQTEYKWGTLGFASLHEFFQDSNVTLNQQLWQGIERFSRDDPDVLSLDDSVHISKVLQEKYIYIASTSSAQYWLDRHCELAMDQRGFGSAVAGFMFQKNSAYEPLFSRKMLQLHESGLWKELERQWRRQLQVTPCHVEPTMARSASLMEVQSALYVLTAGATTALLVFTLEMVVFRLGKRRNSMQNIEIAE